MTQPTRPCPTPRCPQLQPCAEHPRIPFANAQRTGRSLYKTARWKRERKEFLAEHPYCVASSAQAGVACGRPSAVADHRIPHRGDEGLFWDSDNWQALCGRCHNAKTGRETRERMKA